MKKIKNNKGGHFFQPFSSLREDFNPALPNLKNGPKESPLIFNFIKNKELVNGRRARYGKLAQKKTFSINRIKYYSEASLLEKEI